MLFDIRRRSLWAVWNFPPMLGKTPAGYPSYPRIAPRVNARRSPDNIHPGRAKNGLGIR